MLVGLVHTHPADSRDNRASRSDHTMYNLSCPLGPRDTAHPGLELEVRKPGFRINHEKHCRLIGGNESENMTLQFKWE